MHLLGDCSTGFWHKGHSLVFYTYVDGTMSHCVFCALFKEMKQGQTQSAPKEQYKDSEPWFDRFMKLANAVYTRDSESSG